MSGNVDRARRGERVTLSEAEWREIALDGDVPKQFKRTELRKISQEEAARLHCWHEYDGGTIIVVDRQWGYVGIGWERNGTDGKL